MLRVEMPGLGQFLTDLSLAHAKFDRDLSDDFKGFTFKVFHELLEGTPQYSSDLVRNWNLAVGAPSLRYVETSQKSHMREMLQHMEPLERGDMFGIEAAYSRAKQNLGPVSWRDKVFFSNAAPIADDVENHRVSIRPVNLVNGKVEMLQHILDKYS